MGELPLFDLTVIFTLALLGAAILMVISDLAVDFLNRFTVDSVDDVAGWAFTLPSQRPATWQAEAGPTSPGGPARCPICLETQPAVDVFFIRAHGQLVCRPCARLTPAQASLMRTHH